jgi:hypothetical protein
VIGKTTELEAVNIMLETIGESPINSLQDLLPVDATIARSILLETSKAEQSRGWNFNKETDFPLTPDSQTNEINIPVNFIFIDIEGLDTAIRGTKLYNSERHDFTFPQKTYKATVIQLLEFDEMPEQARRYIAIKAARTFQTRAIGSETLHSFSEIEEYKARAELLRYDSRLGKRTMLGRKANMIVNWKPAQVLLR